MTQAEFLAAVQVHRAAWVRKARTDLAGIANTKQHYLTDVESLAQDIVQKTIGELAEDSRYEKIQGPADITKRLDYRVKDFFRKRTELPRGEVDDRETYRFRRGNATIAWVLESAEAFQMRVDVMTAMAALPHMEKAAFALVYEQGLSQDESAWMLGVSQRTVGRLLEQAKGKLRTRLANYR